MFCKDCKYCAMSEPKYEPDQDCDNFTILNGHPVYYTPPKHMCHYGEKQDMVTGGWLGAGIDCYTVRKDGVCPHRYGEIKE